MAQAKHDSITRRALFGALAAPIVAAPVPVVAAPDFEIPGDADHNNTYVVQVRASDGSLVDGQTISVSVTDVSDPLPTVHWSASVAIGPHPAGWLPSGAGGRARSART